MIEVTNLTKRYGSALAVDDVSFRVEPGTVAGFLGPNGAGKSTTLRTILGLTIPTAGTATVLGSPYAALANPAARVGSLLDAAALHPGRTGRESLTLSALALGVGRDRVERVLELVQLTRAETRKRVGTYSLGMRQRLGIAQALLGDPQVLVLDEPANGLDPQGIVWMRRLLRDAADAGCTVLLSSHLLHEVEQVADQLIFIGNGRILADGTPAEVLGGARTLEEAYLQLTAMTARDRTATVPTTTHTGRLAS